MQFTESNIYVPPEIIKKHLVPAVTSLVNPRTMHSVLIVFRRFIDASYIEAVKPLFLTTVTTTKDKDIYSFASTCTITLTYTRYPSGAKHGSCTKILTNEHESFTYVKSNYFNGLKHGYYVKYYDKGLKELEGNYVNGLYDGKWIQYFEDSTYNVISKTIEYKNGLKHGDVIDYNYDGNLEEVTMYEFGKRNGKQVIYDGDNIVSEVYYINDMKEGLDTTYDEGLVIQTSNWHHGQLNGEFINYYYDGQIKYKYNYICGNLYGLMYEYDAYKDTLISITPYREDKIHGLKVNYYPNGEIHILTNYVDGLITGDVLEYYDNGLLRSITPCIDGYMEGISKVYDYDEGTIKYRKYVRSSLVPLSMAIDGAL